MLIRIANEKDAEGIFAVRKKTVSEQNYFVTITEEFKVDIESQKAKIFQNKQNGGLNLVADDSGRIVGFLTFKRNPLKRLNHTGSFGMGILEDYRNQGIGYKMLRNLIIWAKKQNGLEKICLGVLSTNERAIATYKKAGFEEEGREIRQIKFENGKYADNILMGLII